MVILSTRWVILVGMAHTCSGVSRVDGSSWGSRVDRGEGCVRVRESRRIELFGVEVLDPDGSRGSRGCQEEVDG